MTAAGAESTPALAGSRPLSSPRRPRAPPLPPWSTHLEAGAPHRSGGCHLRTRRRGVRTACAAAARLNARRWPVGGAGGSPSAFVARHAAGTVGSGPGPGETGRPGPRRASRAQAGLPARMPRARPKSVTGRDSEAREGRPRCLGSRPATRHPSRADESARPAARLKSRGLPPDSALAGSALCAVRTGLRFKHAGGGLQLRSVGAGSCLERDARHCADERDVRARLPIRTHQPKPIARSRDPTK